MEISTEGVLVLASARGLADEYREKQFDYDFPEGLENMLDRHIIIALQTSDGDELVVEFEEEETDEIPDHELIRYIRILPEDQLLVLSHADFTRICSQSHGDFRQFGHEVEKLENIDAGLYEVKIKVWDPKEEDEDDEEEEEEGWFFRLSVTMRPVEEAPHGNEVTEIND